LFVPESHRVGGGRMGRGGRVASAVAGGHGAGPVVRMVGTDGLGKEVEETVEVPAFGLGGILGTSGRFNLHVQIQQGHKTLRLIRANGLRDAGSAGYKSL